MEVKYLLEAEGWNDVSEKQGTKVGKNNSDHFCETNIWFYTLSKWMFWGKEKENRFPGLIEKIKADTIMKFKSNLPMSNFILMLRF